MTLRLPNDSWSQCMTQRSQLIDIYPLVDPTRLASDLSPALYPHWPSWCPPPAVKWRSGATLVATCHISLCSRKKAVWHLINLRLRLLKPFSSSLLLQGFGIGLRRWNFRPDKMVEKTLTRRRPEFIKPHWASYAGSMLFKFRAWTHNSQSSSVRQLCISKQATENYYILEEKV